MDRSRAAAAVRAFLEALGVDVQGDLEETPDRVAQAWIDDLLCGYRANPAALLKESIPFDGDDLVLLRDLDIATMCPHHLLPAVGRADIVYRPQGRITGLGVIADVVHALSRRLVLQEELGKQIAKALVDHLGASQALCRLRLRHTCLCTRHADARAASFETLSFAGSFDKGGDALLIAALGPREPQPDLRDA